MFRSVVRPFSIATLVAVGTWKLIPGERHVQASAENDGGGEPSG